MRKITQQAVEAFNNAKSFKKSNTQIRVIKQNDGGYLVLFELYGNVIARRETWNGRTYITDAGWETKTTKERLNGLHGVRIAQHNYQWFLNGKAWDGRWIDPVTGNSPTL